MCLQVPMETKRVTSTGAGNTAGYKHLCVNTGTLLSSSEETVGLLNDSAIVLAQHCSIYRLYLFCHMLYIAIRIHCTCYIKTSKKCV